MKQIPVQGITCHDHTQLNNIIAKANHIQLSMIIKEVIQECENRGIPTHTIM